MKVLKTESIELSTDQDLIRARNMVRMAAAELGLGLVDQTKFVTAASELARNCLLHGGGGRLIVETIENTRKGLKLSFIDSGPGISDIARAMTDGYTSADGLGLGLGGAKRLSDQFEIKSQIGQGTTVIITKWK